MDHHTAPVRRVLSALLLLVGALALVGGALAAPATAARPGTGTISGVVRGPDDAPAAGVVVTAMEAGAGSYYVGATTRTDASGRYTVDVEAGGFDLRVEDPQGRFAQADVLGLAVRAGATTRRDVGLARGLVLTGRVARADDGPVAGIDVQVTTPDTRRSFVERTARVAADGTYTVRGLHRATWRVLVDPFRATDALLLAHDLGGGARPGREWGTGTSVQVSGDQALPDVVLRHRTPVVRGTVRGVGGRPAAGVTVHTDDENWWLDDGESAPYPGIGDLTGADGRYELRLDQAGRTVPLLVSTDATGYAVRSFGVRVPAVDRAVGVDVRLRSTARAAVEVRSRRGTQPRVRVSYVPAVRGASRVAAVTVRYRATDGKARKARGTLDRRGTLTVRLPKAKRGVRAVKVHVAGNADAAPVTRSVRARVR